MPEYLSPGVYIEEQDTGPEPIEGVSTSVTGFVGVTQRGPADTLGPVLVTSFADFQNTFGTYFMPQFTTAPPYMFYNLLPHAVAGFFNNGGQLLYIKRVYNLSPGLGPKAATPLPLENAQGSPTLITRLTATAITGATTLRLASMRGVQNGTTLVLTQVKNGVTTTSTALTVASYNDASNTVTLTAALPAPPAPAVNYDSQYTSVALTSNGGFVPAPDATNFAMQAADPGAWGNSIQLQITPASRYQGQVQSISGTTVLVLQSAANFYVGAIIEINTGGEFTVAGSVTSGAFTSGEVVTQATSGATASVLAAVPAGGPMTLGPITGVPDATDTWKGQSSSAVFTPTALPAAVNGGKYYGKIQSVSGNGITLTAALAAAAVTAITANLAATPPVPTVVKTCEFNISDSYGSVSETFTGLTLDPNTPYFYATTIINNSAILSVPVTQLSPPAISPYPFDNTATDPSTMPVATDGLNVLMDPTTGTDGTAPTNLDYVGNDYGPGSRTGIQALIDQADISIIGAPGVYDQTTQEALIAQCENLKYRFAILDPGPSATFGKPSLNDVQAQRSNYDTKYAAIYYPRIVVTDPLTDNPLTVAPSGHMAGIYAQTDDSRGVWKAPANIVINGITAIETRLSKGDQDILNPDPTNICVLRDFTAQDRGLRVYGARCITSDTEWKYINVRRLFIYIEASLDQGTQWAVFEPNDQKLWNRLIQSVSAFLTTIWRAGGLMGSKAEEAFFVKCGLDTMTQDDLENGRLVMLVGVAPVYPAEFVIIRIGQWAGGSSVQEL